VVPVTFRLTAADGGSATGRQRHQWRERGSMRGLRSNHALRRMGGTAGGAHVLSIGRALLLASNRRRAAAGTRTHPLPGPSSSSSGLAWDLTQAHRVQWSPALCPTPGEQRAHQRSAHVGCAWADPLVGYVSGIHLMPRGRR
jgi:hypothetical protein